MRQASNLPTQIAGAPPVTATAACHPVVCRRRPRRGVAGPLLSLPATLLGNSQNLRERPLVHRTAKRAHAVASTASSLLTARTHHSDPHGAVCMVSRPCLRCPLRCIVLAALLSNQSLTPRASCQPPQPPLRVANLVLPKVWPRLSTWLSAPRAPSLRPTLGQEEPMSATLQPSAANPMWARPLIPTQLLPH